MTKLFLIPCILVSITLFAQPKAKQKKMKSTAASASNDSIPMLPKPSTKYTDNVDDRMKGPNGEKVFIGPGGGRYYLKNDKKIYLPFAKKVKKI